VTALEIAGLLRDYGPWGLVALFGFVIASLHKDLKACNKSALDDRDRLIIAMHAAATAADKTTSVLDSIRQTLATHKDASEDLTKQVELAAQETRHQLANMHQALMGIAGKLDRPIERATTRGRP
jgi:hypothetical protein